MELNLDLNKRYSFADYITWFDNKRRELWDGFIKLMTPAPNLYHQKVSSELFGLFYSHFKKNQKKCQLFHAPFDVRFPKNGKKADNEIFTVVQPDIVVVCDKSKLDKRGCLGAPDFIAEIVSPKTAKHDMEDKYKLYEENGVNEYWIVFPHEKVVQSFILKEGKYSKVGTFAKGEMAPVSIFNNELEVDLDIVFEDLEDEN